MKALKSFLLTLAAVMAVGVLFLVGKGILQKDSEASSLTVKTEAAGGSSVSKEAAGSKETAGNTKTQQTERKKANPIVKAVVTEAIDVYIDNADDEVKQVAESMTEEDRDTVTEIIAGNVSLDSVTELKSYLSSGDTDSIMKYAEDNLSEEEMAELEDILSKYAQQ